ncbi:hypothetical protein NDU88_005820 [Pleurodeles waltl]|uniref:Uncharacterized protein n=1 Tax=Pleurodeles waltl TaxID=8319 RepID=A0AAV7WZU4_PLEWA|nr:hypothetical protein NDU88_005820 [Pleurodeles waltl]
MIPHEYDFVIESGMLKSNEAKEASQDVHEVQELVVEQAGQDFESQESYDDNNLMNNGQDFMKFGASGVFG